MNCSKKLVRCLIVNTNKSASFKQSLGRDSSPPESLKIILTILPYSNSVQTLSKFVVYWSCRKTLCNNTTNSTIKKVWFCFWLHLSLNGIILLTTFCFFLNFHLHIFMWYQKKFYELVPPCMISPDRTDLTLQNLRFHYGQWCFQLTLDESRHPKSSNQRE